ncbi:hypothetical protein J6590_048064 [Homalodisca vitripennis]|nr:hypothetical protein J6590_048064 [Homalodisca vitripennis]
MIFFYPTVKKDLIQKEHSFDSEQDAVMGLEAVLKKVSLKASSACSWHAKNTVGQVYYTQQRDAIKELNQICRIPHKPTAICRYQNCLKISTHILPSELIHIR